MFDSLCLIVNLDCLGPKIRLIFFWIGKTHKNRTHDLQIPCQRSILLRYVVRSTTMIKKTHEKIYRIILDFCFWLISIVHVSASQYGSAPYTIKKTIIEI